MRIQLNERGITLERIATDLKLEGGAYYLENYHNFHVSASEKITSIETEIPVETIIHVPDKPLQREKPSKEDIKATEQHLECLAFIDLEEEAEEAITSKSEHDGKYYVIQKGICQCDKGFDFPNFKVISHKKHYWNNAKASDDYLAVTDADMQFTPPIKPFGKCKLRPSLFGYLSCNYIPLAKWENPYENTKVMDNSCLTEISKLRCATGGIITVKKHGQISELGLNNIRRANVMQQILIDPLVDFEEFKASLEEENEPEIY